MNKEQAIDLLDNLIGMIEDNQGNDYDTAFRMAIEALKAQLSLEGTTSDQPVATDTNVGNNSEIPNSSDCISRQQAIDYCYQLINVEHQQGSDEMNYGQERVNQTETILHHLELMPSVQPEPQWIPLEEKMPDTNVDILLQFESNMTVGFYEDGDWAINTGDGIYSMIGDNEEKPIAWMPLPTPYRKGAAT